MTGSKLTALTSIGASVSGDDLIYIVDAPGGTPASKNISLTNLFGSLNVSLGFGTDSTYNIGSDTVRPAVVYSDVVDSPTVRGGSTSGGDLRLDSTGHATPGKVYVGGGIDDYYDEVNSTWRQKASRFGDVRFNSRLQRALVTLIFDDGYGSVHDDAKPVFDAQGEVGCAAVITDAIGTAGKMTSTQLLALQAAGWEILSHSKTHADLTSLSDAELRIELGTSQSVLRGLGLTCDNFVYPGHYQNATVWRVTREYYRAARGGDVQGVNRTIPRTYALASYSALGTANLVATKALVDAAETASAWLILYWHQADADTLDAVNQIIDYVQAKNISIVTMNGALDLIGNLVDAGDQLAIGESGIRTPALDVIDRIRIWPYNYPETYSASISYDAGKLVLSPLSASYPVTVASANAFRPNTNGTINLGGVGLRWGDLHCVTEYVSTVVVANATPPSTSPADVAQLYSADQTAGNACLHTRTEAGQIIKLYQQANIADPTGGGTTDAEARTAINAILDILQNNGLMAAP